MSIKKRVQKQMEFYLSSSNLRNDKFLQQSMDEDGFIELSVFLSFNRLKALGATERIVRGAVEKSSLLILSDNGAYVRPKELPNEQDDDSIERTIYIENFPSGSDHDSLRKLFARFGKVKLVSMPRFQGSKKFKGFAFIEFASVDAVATALETLKRDKKDENAPTKGISGMAKARWVTLRDSLKEQMATKHQTTESTSGTLRHTMENALKNPSKDFFTRGLLLRLSNISHNTLRKALKTALEAAAPVAFIDESKLRSGLDTAIIRFLSTSHTTKVLEYFTKTPLVLDNQTISIERIEGDEEAEYWTTLVNAQHAKNEFKRSAESNEHQAPPPPLKKMKNTKIVFDD
ncbi:hypothetical protein THRCLA_02270 [Thraustotheca clavata]|uniref:La-related protein 7 n=1 Tax=Thraustotheca clavata TaxID=74557 RepID=A0A1W0A5U0_9STRA|nr:hypothetical protein THRCLA_02270 [Thraustotheca clavata]